MADQTDIAKFLLSRNADMNVPVGKEQGSTVLHIALNRGQYQMFKLLMTLGNVTTNTLNYLN